LTDHGRHLRGLAIATVVTITVALFLVFFYAPQDATLGYIQKIFYLHVPLAIVSLCGFVLGGLLAIGYLRTGDKVWDMRSYCAIHISLIFSVGGIIAGSIWAKASWGHWWLWSEPTLVSYLIVILLFCTYQPLRFSIEDPERQARYAAVFAVVCGAFVPINFIVVRLSVAYVHPRILNLEGGALPGSMKLTFYISLLAIALLFATLMKYEMAAKEMRIETRRLRRRLLGDDAVRPLGRTASPS
jgi:heme exporter protein C